MVYENYTMIYKNGERMRDFLGVFIFIVVQFSTFWGVFKKTIIPLALVGYEMIIANSAAIYHLISNALSKNDR